MKYQFKKYSVLAIIALSSWLALGAKPAKAEMELENAFFYIESFRELCTDCKTYQYSWLDKNSEGNIPAPNVDLDYSNRYLMTGRIEINQINSDDFTSHKVVIENVKLQMSLKGVIADLTFGSNTRMRLTGLSGHQVGDIFKGEFTGGKVRVQLLLNLSLMVASNSNGIGLIDNEDLISVGAAFDVGKVGFKFALENTVNTVTHYRSGNVVSPDVRKDVASELLI